MTNLVHKHPHLEAYKKQGLQMHVIDREKWDLELAKKMVKRIDTDGMGTPYGLRGHVSFPYPIVFNGGKLVNGEWFDGIYQDLPEVPEGFEFVHRSSWGWQLVNRLEQTA